jgi:hypothetical protein
MGGKALKDIETVRLGVDDFLQLQSEVVEKLSAKFGDIRPTVYYRSKDSFGDLDIIIGRPIPHDIKDWIRNSFKSKSVVHNGESLQNAVTVSFEYKNFQVDLIINHPENIEIAHFYYSYNDLGNYVGRIASEYQLKFGFNGLHYRGRIFISKDPKKIYEFLGFSYNLYLKGFDTLNEIFDYVITSKHFSNHIYFYENLDNVNRSRNKKRPNYQKFLDYLKDSNINVIFEYPKTDQEAINIIDAYFPEANLKWILQEEFNNNLMQEKVRTLLNSTVVNDLLQLSNDWNIIKKVIDQIYTLPDAIRKLSSLKQEEMNKVIKAAYVKVSERPEIAWVGKRVMYRTQHHGYLTATALEDRIEHVHVQNDDNMVYNIKKDRLLLPEDWFDFQNMTTRLLKDVVS